MKKFEHMQLTLNPVSLDLDSKMREYGLQGWEMCGAVPSWDHSPIPKYVTYYFKREICQPPTNEAGPAKEAQSTNPSAVDH